jgi:hypothetical protein
MAEPQALNPCSKSLKRPSLDELESFREPSLNPGFCGTCKDMFTWRGVRRLNSSEGFRHLTDTNIQQAAGNGCQFCDFFLQYVNRLQDTGLEVFHTPGNGIIFQLRGDGADQAGAKLPFSIDQIVGYQTVNA